MNVTLERAPEGSPNFCFGLYGPIDGAMACIAFAQSDWDYPALASPFGFVPCECGATDGTVDCGHRSAAEMIAAAFDFLVEHVGAEVEVDDQ